MACWGNSSFQTEVGLGEPEAEPLIPCSPAAPPIMLSGVRLLRTNGTQSRRAAVTRRRGRRQGAPVRADHLLPRLPLGSPRRQPSLRRPCRGPRCSGATPLILEYRSLGWRWSLVGSVGFFCFFLFFMAEMSRLPGNSVLGTDGAASLSRCRATASRRANWGRGGRICMQTLF